MAEKIILFVVHKQRFEKDVKLKKIVIPDLIPLINYEYNQIFIDNLQETVPFFTAYNYKKIF